MLVTPLRKTSDKPNPQGNPDLVLISGTRKQKHLEMLVQKYPVQVTLMYATLAPSISAELIQWQSSKTSLNYRPCFCYVEPLLQNYPMEKYTKLGNRIDAWVEV